MARWSSCVSGRWKIGCGRWMHAPAPSAECSARRAGFSSTARCFCVGMEGGGTDAANPARVREEELVQREVFAEMSTFIERVQTAYPRPKFTKSDLHPSPIEILMDGAPLLSHVDEAFGLIERLQRTTGYLVQIPAPPAPPGPPGRPNKPAPPGLISLTNLTVANGVLEVLIWWGICPLLLNGLHVVPEGGAGGAILVSKRSPYAPGLLSKGHRAVKAHIRDSIDIGRQKSRLWLYVDTVLHLLAPDGPLYVLLAPHLPALLAGLIQLAYRAKHGDASRRTQQVLTEVAAEASTPPPLGTVLDALLRLLQTQRHGTWGLTTCTRMLTKILVGRHMRGVETIATQFLGALQIPYGSTVDEDGNIVDDGDGVPIDTEASNPLYQVVRLVTTLPTSFKTHDKEQLFYRSIAKQCQKLSAILRKHPTATGNVLVGHIAAKLCEMDVTGSAGQFQRSGCLFLTVLFPCIVDAGRRRDGDDDSEGTLTTRDEQTVEKELEQLSVFLEICPPNETLLGTCRGLLLVGLLRIYVYTTCTKSWLRKRSGSALARLCVIGDHSKTAAAMSESVFEDANILDGLQYGNGSAPVFAHALSPGPSGGLCISRNKDIDCRQTPSSLLPSRSPAQSRQTENSVPQNVVADAVMELLRFPDVQETTLPGHLFCRLLSLCAPADSFREKVERDAGAWSKASGLLAEEIFDHEGQLKSTREKDIVFHADGGVDVEKALPTAIPRAVTTPLQILPLLISMSDSMGAALIRNRGLMLECAITILSRFAATLAIDEASGMNRVRIGLAVHDLEKEEAANGRSTGTGELAAKIAMEILSVLMDEAVEQGWDIGEEDLDSPLSRRTKLLVSLGNVLETLSFHPSDEVAEKAVALRVSLLATKMTGIERDTLVASLRQVSGDEVEEDGGVDRVATTYIDSIQQLQERGNPALRAYGLVTMNKLLRESPPDNPKLLVSLVDTMLSMLTEEESFVYLAAVQSLGTAVEVAPAQVLPYLINIFQDRTRTLSERCKLGEVLAVASRRLGEMLPHYAATLIEAFSLPASARVKRGDYKDECSPPLIHGNPVLNKKDEELALDFEWAAFRASCLSNLADIVLTLNQWSRSFHSNLCDIGVGILQFERCAEAPNDETIHLGTVQVRRAAVFLLRAIATSFVSLSMSEVAVAVKTELSRVAVDDVDSVTRYHAGLALEEFRGTLEGSLLFEGEDGLGGDRARAEENIPSILKLAKSDEPTVGVVDKTPLTKLKIVEL